jgi:transposase
LAGRDRWEGGVLEESQDTEEIVQRVAALDLGKAELTCCVRVPGSGKSGRRLQEVRTYQTMTRSLLVMVDRLAELGVTRVVMEATSDYWKGVFYLLEAHGFQAWLAGARDVKHLPGIFPGGPRPTRWTRCGCASSPSGRCCAQLRAAPGDPAAAGRGPLPG